MSETDRLIEINKMANSLRNKELNLKNVVERVFEKQKGTNKFLIFIDQWEELYTLCEDRNIRDSFIDELLNATINEKISVVLTLRGDFYGHAVGYRRLADRMQGNVVNIGPMNGDEIKLAIEEPAKKVGLAFERGLAKKILDDVGREPGNLPLLEFTLSELWEKRQCGFLLHDAYEDMGGIQGSIAKRAEDIFSGLNDLEKLAVKKQWFSWFCPGF